MYKYKILQVDTDGLHMGISSNTDDSNKQQVVDLIKSLEKKWQEKLNYSDFVLDIEPFAFMLNIGHKNYIYGKLDSPETILTKGNNFKAKNKSKLSENIMKKVIYKSLKDVGNWELKNKEQIRNLVKSNILKFTEEEVSKINMDEIDIEQLILYENVNPVAHYKKEDSIYALRTIAIEKLLDEKITHSTKLPMLVHKNPLPNIPSDKLSKKGVKCIHYMYPMDYITEDMIDYQWYKDNASKYIMGAFSLNKTKNKKKQKILSSGQFSLDDF